MNDKANSVLAAIHQSPPPPHHCSRLKFFQSFLTDMSLRAVSGGGIKPDFANEIQIFSGKYTLGTDLSYGKSFWENYRI
jgi:hypothetical protein